MRTSLTMGVSLLLFMGIANLVGAQQPPANSPSYTMYSAIPRVPGIKTLIDFNDYDAIITAAKGYTNQRYTEAQAAAAAAVGLEVGMPVEGFSIDPDGDLDKHSMRQLTKVGNLFASRDAARDGDAYASAISGGDPDAKPDYSKLPKDRFGAVEYTISQEDMKLDSWLVDLNSSAATIPNRRHSYAKGVKSFDGSKTYLGVRVHFPTHRHNANVRIAPQYNLPAFDARGYPINYGIFDPQSDDKGIFDAAAPTHEAVKGAVRKIEAIGQDASKASQISYAGVVHNVADIKKIAVRVSGRNYNNGLAIRLRDHNQEVSEYFLGYLNFPGWRTMEWVNPNYIPAEDVEPFRLPLYPTEIPYIAFDSFVIYRNGSEIGGDFVTAFEWVKLDYDLAVPPAQLDVETPDFINIDDDGYWYILRDRNAAETRALMKRFSEQVDLRRQQLGRSIRQAEGVSPVENDALQARKEYEAGRAGAAAPAPAPGAR